MRAVFVALGAGHSARSKKHNIISAQSYRPCMDDNLLAMFGLQVKYRDPDTIDSLRGSIIDEIFY